MPDSPDIWLYGLPITIEVDWNGDGYLHAAADVSDAWTAYKFEGGSHGRANPQRALPDAGSGYLSLYGPDYIPGESSVLSASQLKSRHAFRVRQTVGVTVVTLVEGYIVDGRYSGGRITTFKLLGKIEIAARRQVNILQATQGINTGHPGTLRDLAMAVGLTQLAGTQMVTVELDSYNYQGSAQRYLSQYGLVSGTIPIVRADGGLGLYSPTDGPADITLEIDGEHYNVRSVTTEISTDEIRNYMDLKYLSLQQFTRDEELESGGPNSLFESAARSGPSAGAKTASFTLPALGAGKVYKNIGLQSYTSWAEVIKDHYTNPSAFQTGAYLDILGFTKTYTKTTAPGLTVAVSSSGSAGGPINVTVTATLSAPIPGTWRWTQRRATRTSRHSADYTFNGTVTGNTASSQSDWREYISGLYTPLATANLNIFALGIDAVVEWEVETTNAEEIVIQNQDSIDEYERRELSFPLWVDPSAQAVLQERIDDLSAPRTYHNVELEVTQPDDARTLEIARLQAGDYLGLDISNPQTLDEIHADCLCLRSGYLMTSGADVVKRITVVELPDTPHVSHVYLGFGDDNPVKLGGEQLAMSH